MRAASRCPARPIQSWYDLTASCSLASCSRIRPFPRPRRSLAPRTKIYPPTVNYLPSRQRSTISGRHDAASTPRNGEEEEAEDEEDACSRLTGSGRGSPAVWASQFSALLPHRLGGSSFTLRETGASSTFDLAKVDSIISGALKHAKVDIWCWMVKNGRKKAAVWLMETSLKTLVAHEDKLHEKHPSNINWPENVFKQIKQFSTSRDLTYSPEHAWDYQSAFNSDQSPEPASDVPHNMFNSIWATLGRLVVDAAASTPDQAEHIMSAVKLILALVHNLGMVPTSIYDSRIYPHSVYVQRPPILHLVSSRILTALSDATWREQQNDAIHQATAMGISLKEISESVPGGRFRLKVRPLAPEIWLEFILWCCVERGHTLAACRIIANLRDQTEDPWFAIRWCSDQRSDKLNVTIDWERMQRRHGGTVGLIEGYSREKPFVDVPDRTISVEVVLAVLDALLSQFEVTNTRDSTVLAQKREVEEFRRVVSFLEPHDLPPHYFDYIESRSLQSGAFDMVNRPALLQAWSSNVDGMRCLEPATTDSSPSLDLRFDSIVANTLLHAALQHQALEGLIQIGDVHRSLAQFNVIQEHVDQHKFKSIINFLQSQSVSGKGFFSSRLFRYRLEYADSHGQLPNYKLAGFLNLISDTRLVGLGQWLLYSDDIDGSLIPESAYGLSCMATALCRFATVSGDSNLLAKVVAQVNSSRRMPSLRLLRRLFDADVQNSDFANARNQLWRLKRAQAGGIGLSNIAHLAGMIMMLEAGRIGLPRARTFQLGQATTIMEEVLRGDHNSPRGDFTLEQRMLFKQQIAHILKIFYRSGCRRLRSLAIDYVEQYRGGNLVSLPANIFNILLSAIATVRGHDAAKALWDLYCQDIGMQEDRDNLNASTVAFDAEGEIAGPFVHTDASSNIYTTSISDAPDSDFADPFFQQRVEENVSRSSSPWGPDAKSEPNESSQVESQEHSRDILLSAGPITIPNLQTLRIIVRAAVEEKSQAMNDNNSQLWQSADRTLRWSIPKFDKIGNLSKSVVQQEIGQEIEQPVSTLDEAPENLVDRPGSPIDLARRVSTEKGRLKEASISGLWVPKKPTKKIGRRPARARG